tara:strand:- start:2697 stop:3311 length:615 start_codon:yes stop_codon:yes gene_type:complete
MMDKLASEAYSRGALYYLDKSDVPTGIKIASARALIKESGKVKDLVKSTREAVANRVGNLANKLDNSSLGTSIAESARGPWADSWSRNKSMKEKALDLILGNYRRQGLTRGTQLSGKGAVPTRGHPYRDELLDAALLDRQVRAAKGIGTTAALGTGLVATPLLLSSDTDTPGDSLELTPTQEKLLAAGVGAGLGYGTARLVDNL